MKKPTDTDSYIASFPKETQKLLQQVRKAIQEAAPKAEEYIGYGMPAYKLNGPLVYFAGYEHHIGFYPTGSGIAAFTKEIEKYKSSKGAVQFPLDKPIPVTLIKKMVKFKIAENAEKAKLKGKK
ncbi:MAG TPA: DUF1801 domain-containing protein [Bacteroidia bacterium]|nr:DUF1801 domain-containing protein [Bacteroidia bacterium]